MRVLSGLDASFIYLETDHSPMHIGGVYLFDSATAPESFGFDTFREHVQKRLSCSQIFRQRLVEVPLSLSHPYWINDPDFELTQHLPRLKLPGPGGLDELMKLSAQIFGEPLDRSRPLWELNFVEGLDRVPGLSKASFAIVTKVHHAAIDGGSGVELMGALLDLEATPRVITTKDDWKPEHLPSTAKMVAAAYSKVGQKSVELAKVVGELASGTIQAYGNRRARRIDPPTLPFTAPASVLNGSVSSSRTYWGIDFAFDRIRHIRKLCPEATVNDIILTICASGLRNYLIEKGELPDKPLVTMAPISVRKEDQKGKMGNQVSAMLVSLATDIENPVERLLRISSHTRASKTYSSAIPAHKITEFIPSETLAAATRLYTRTRMGARHRPFFNLTITNVPGPPMPLYWAGARISGQFGMAPIIDGMGLIIVVLSYAGRISLGLTSCYNVIPDPAHLGELIEKGLAELENELSSIDLDDLESTLQEIAEEQTEGAGVSAVERLKKAGRSLDKAMASLEKKMKK